MKVGVSTLAFGKLNREKIASLAEKKGWMIEFSSSFPHQPDMAAYFEKIQIRRLAHNYFPAPAVPFVINLASRNPDIRERSIEHCLQGLKLTKACKGRYFSAHAGFCIDPNPSQLGKELSVEVQINRDENWDLFLDSLKRIMQSAHKLDVSFLVENNVTALKNLRSDGQEVLLCTSPDEICQVVNEVGDPRFGILLDTAHLKVSANALNFNRDQAVSQIREYVRYVHHSDNNGIEDSNSSINGEYWFLSHMKEFSSCIHILEVKNINESQIDEQLNLLEYYGQR